MIHLPSCRAAASAVAALVGCAAVAAPAAASVLFTPPAKRITTRGCISVQLWYRAADGGSRRVTITVRQAGKQVARRRITAPSQWRRYKVHCPGAGRTGTYVTTIAGADWHVSYRTRVVA
jgi:hypothetical protein